MLDLIGRVRPGANITAMEAQMQVQLRQFLLSPLSKVEARDQPLVAHQVLHLSHGGNGVQMMRDQYKDGLHLLMWVSGFVLLIACANPGKSNAGSGQRLASNKLRCGRL